MKRTKPNRKKKKSKSPVIKVCFVCYKIITNGEKKASYQTQQKDSLEVYYCHEKHQPKGAMAGVLIGKFMEMEKAGEVEKMIIQNAIASVHLTSEQFEPSMDQKGDDLAIIKMVLQDKGPMTRREIHLVTGIKESTVTWRIWDGLINPKRKKTLFFISAVAKGIGLVAYDPQEPEYVHVEMDN